MVFTKLLLQNALAIRPCNYEVASEPLLHKVARCIPVLSSHYIGKSAALALKCSANSHPSPLGIEPDGRIGIICISMTHRKQLPLCEF